MGRHAVTHTYVAVRDVAGKSHKVAGYEVDGFVDWPGAQFPSDQIEVMQCAGLVRTDHLGFLGLACESVIGVDVVTADGEQIHCDTEHHPDFYWAARGSGPGFFGVVTAYHLMLYPRPAVCGAGVYIYPFELVDEVFTWAREIGPEVDRRVELQIAAARAVPSANLDQPGISILSPVFAESEDAAIQALALLDTCPVVDQAMLRVPYAPTTLAAWYDEITNACPTGYRYATDNMWTSAWAEDLLPGIRRTLDTMRPYPSQMLWVN